MIRPSGVLAGGKGIHNSYRPVGLDLSESPDAQLSVSGASNPGAGLLRVRAAIVSRQVGIQRNHRNSPLLATHSEIRRSRSEFEIYC